MRGKGLQNGSAFNRDEIANSSPRFPHYSFNFLTSGLIRVDEKLAGHHPRPAQPCPHLVLLIIASPINLPDLENGGGRGCDDHGLLFLAGAGSSPRQDS